jgi:hypothetical protein
VSARETLKYILMCDRGLRYDRLNVTSKASLVKLSINNGAAWEMGEVSRSHKTMALTKEYYHTTSAG